MDVIMTYDCFILVLMLCIKVQPDSDFEGNNYHMSIERHDFTVVFLIWKKNNVILQIFTVIFLQPY